MIAGIVVVVEVLVDVDDVVVVGFAVVVDAATVVVGASVVVASSASLPPPPQAAMAMAGGEHQEGGTDQGGASSFHQSSLRSAIRSSSGGWVSKSRWMPPSLPSSPTPLIGCSIHKCAVAVDAECVTVVSAFNFSSAEISPGGYAGELAGAHVGQRLTAARDRRLHRLGHDRRHDQQEKPHVGERIVAVRLVAATADPTAVPPHRAHGDVRHQGDRADHRDRQRRHQDVVVADVTQFMGEHTLEFDPIHLLEQTGRHGDRRVVRIAAGGEGVRCRIVDDVDAGLGQATGDAQPFDEVVQPLVLRGIGGRRPTHTQRDLVGVPVRAERHDAPNTRAITANSGPLPKIRPDDRADDDDDDHEPDDEQHAAALVRADQFEHREATRTDRIRTRPSAPHGRPRRPRSTRARRSSPALAMNTVGTCWILLL